MDCNPALLLVLLTLEANHLWANPKQMPFLDSCARVNIIRRSQCLALVVGVHKTVME